MSTAARRQTNMAASMSSVARLARLRSCFTVSTRAVSYCNGHTVGRVNGKAVNCRSLRPPQQFPDYLRLRHVHSRALHTGYRLLSESPAAEAEEADLHNIIKDTEKVTGSGEQHSFQAETLKLLDIVAKSLYSDKEVFVRELISNASDALEKLRYLSLTQGGSSELAVPLEIHLGTDLVQGTFTIQDTGVGLTQEEIIENLGTIARSGSKAFLSELDNRGQSSSAASSIIGQFGVGFYSTFMVGDKVQVFTRSHQPDSPGYCWTSDGSGSYELAEAEGVQLGTKIVVHLKKECMQFAREDDIKEIVTKYSNFVNCPIYLNGKRLNTVEALWMLDAKNVTDEQHEEFYRFLANAYDSPRYRLQYQTDAPLNIRSLFYIPAHKPTMWDMSRQEGLGGVALYSRRVLIQPKAETILPKWLRFVKGVVDSEDIPLNLSRELLQDSALIRKIRSVLTSRIVKFLGDQARRDAVKYQRFVEDYGFYLREGIVSTEDQDERESIAKLLRFESSAEPEGTLVGIEEYCKRMRPGQRNIYYFSAPSRQLAETSPYFEALKKKDIEVLFCYEQYDELVLLQLRQFQRLNLKSIENEVLESDKTEETQEDSKVTLSPSKADALMDWMRSALGEKVTNIKVSTRLESHPAMVTVMEMGAARHYLRTAFAGQSEAERWKFLQPTLEINSSHPIMLKLSELKSSDPELARLVAEQVYDNALVAAGLIEDPRSMLNRLNELLTRTLDKH
ncbi:heat shock protein 75 kDa, mitochondrial-like [Branchiostoma floridae]|uniref:Heat shock protein 75 kDa, mitochondrial n=1 Tax=Branchiostoma floridae TaxID=7739 RepID=A0A9J7MW15_BRAFL|nr:heat shock protein 75 kDa, mitochondrial-like [Branchiostoma floridae]